MKKLFAVILAVTLIAGLPAGCGKKDEPEEESSTSSRPSAPEEDAAALTIYTPLPQELARRAADGFAAASGAEVKLVFGASNELVRRMKAESAAPKADLLFGVGAEVAQQFSELFAPYKSAEAADIEPAFLDKQGVWTPLTPMPIVLMYNKEQTSRAPAGWSSLVGDSYKGWVSFADPAVSGTSYTALRVMRQVGVKDALKEDAFIERFATNLDGKMLANISDVYKRVASGALASGVTLESSAQKYLDAGYQDKIGISYPVEGTTAALEVSAVANGARNEKLAQEFIDYVSGEQFQRELVAQYQRRSVRTDVPDPEGFVARADIKFVDYDYSAAVSDRSWLLEVFGKAEQSMKQAGGSTSAAG